jgi:hypothetical protein
VAHLLSRWVVRASIPTVLALTTWSLRADAQPLDPQQIAVAEALVEQGRKLLDEGKVEAACQKFTEAVSASESWATGALAQLAECHEKAGRLGSAWGTWVKAEIAATRAGQRERSDYAKARAAELDGRVPKLTIVVPDALKELAGVELARDGVAISKEQWGLPIRVDPGRHTVRVRATRRLSWEATLDVRAGEVQLVAPERLDEQPAPPVAAPPVDTEVGKVQRYVGVATGALGLASLEAGFALSVMAATRGADAGFVCPVEACAAETGGVDLRKSAAQARTGAIVLSALGAAIMASGVAIYATAPSPPTALGKRPASAGVRVLVGLGGVGVSGQW